LFYAKDIKSTIKGRYNKKELTGIISKPYSIQGTNITKAITIGNNIVQQKDIN
jgi:hypothetical protein